MTVFTQWGPHGRAPQASINQPSTSSHQPSGPTTAHTDYRRSSPSLAQPPAPAPHLLMTNKAWQAAAEMSWPGQPRTHHYHKRMNTKQFDPVSRGAVEAKCKKKPPEKKPLNERSVLEPVTELIEINIHDWAPGPGHLAAHLMPTSVTVRRRPAGSLLRSCACHGLQRGGSQRAADVQQLRAPASAPPHKDMVDMDWREL